MINSAGGDGHLIMAYNQYAAVLDCTALSRQRCRKSDVPPGCAQSVPAELPIPGTWVRVELHIYYNQEESAMIALPDPVEHECLPCYLYRVSLDNSCPGQLEAVKNYRDHNAPRATALERKIMLLGGYCDCEALTNAFRPITTAAAFTIDASENLVCKGVRRGSIQPCEQWVMRRGVQWGGGRFRRRSA